MAGEIQGKDWNTEVGRVGTDPETLKKQEKFYKARAQLKLGIPNLEQVLDDPNLCGLSSADDLERFDDAHKEIPLEGKFEVGSEEALGEILTKYFRQNLEGIIKDKKTLERRVAKEVYLTLHYLTQQKDESGQKISADLVNRGETVEITKGKLYIYTTTAAGENAKQVRINGVYLRKPKPGARAAAQPVLQELIPEPPKTPEIGKEALAQVDQKKSEIEALITKAETFEGKQLQDFEQALRAANTITRSTSDATHEEKVAAIDDVFYKAKKMREDIKAFYTEANIVLTRLREEQSKLDFYELSNEDQDAYRNRVDSLAAAISGLDFTYESLGEQMKHAAERWKDAPELNGRTFGDEQPSG
ncbi:MAG: hypothetical protein AAB588_06445 [Patescibacteria group bacterium]